MEQEDQCKFYCGSIGQNKSNSTEGIFEMIIAKNCPKLIKDTNTHMSESQ